jgi:amidase
LPCRAGLRKQCVMTETTWLDACALAELVQTGRASPAELVDAAVDRVRRDDPALGALVRERLDAAAQEARGELPDSGFRGVPLLLKDIGCHVAGEATHYGTTFLRDADWRSPVDSHLARAFRAAGFVVLGRTRVPELGTTVTTEPIALGPTRNPWDTTRTAGGSSGGSAAAVAAGLVPVAHGGDGGGSIRIPASLCGLVGLKPSRGRVSQGPQVGEAWAGATTDGVLTRTVRDTAALLDVVSAPMPGDPYWAPPPRRPFAQEVGVEPGRLRVGLLPAPPQDDLPGDEECRAAVLAAGHLLEQLGHDVEIAHPAALGDARFSRQFNRTIAADVALVVEQFGRAIGRPVEDAELEPRDVDYRGVGRSLSATDYLQTRAWLGRFTRKVAAWWASPEEGGAGFDLLVSPTVNGPPPPLGWLEPPGDTRLRGQRVAAFMPFTAQFNVTGQPAVSLPLHVGGTGLPVGVQLVAAYAREDLLVRVAAQLEQAAPWRDRRPPSTWQGKDAG